MRYKSLLALLLALALCLGLVACGNKTEPTEPSTEAAGTTAPQVTEPEPAFPVAEIGTELGNGIADFSFTTCDGQTYSLYETLKEKKLVLINMWASWCGPCQAEFPFMEEAYQQYKDDIEIFALSVEEEDTDEVISEFAASLGLTFPMGKDTPNLFRERFYTGAVPTSVIIDRFGTICFMEASSVTSVETFQRLFDIFLAEDYTESVILEDGLPAKLPDVAAEDPADLAAVLGQGLTYVNPEDQYNWPLIIEDDHVVSTNVAQGDSVSSLNVELTAAAGDVFAVDYAVSSEAGYDFLTIYVNDELVKYMSGERDWATFAYEFEAAGDYTVTLAYEKDEAGDGGNDVACFMNLRLLTGDEAAALLASLPVYPYSDETTFTVTNPDAREVIIDDPTGTLANAFGDVKWYIIPGDTVSFSATLAEGLDAECASFLSYFDGDCPALSDCVVGDHYEFSTNGIDSYEETGSGYCYVEFTASVYDAPVDIFFFHDEANLNAFLARNFTQEDGTLPATWKYADGSAPESTVPSEGVDALAEGNAIYYLVFVDQNGDPVEGVTANVCDDASCTPMVSGANGVIGFAYPQFAYHIQVIKIPDGYDFDLSTEIYVEAEGGVAEFVVTKN